MEESRIFSEQRANPDRSAPGVISRIRLENFMCHSSLQIDLGDWVNFITGQNGSGKSAILTALCVAFGCRAKGTQRANALKDLIKTGCSYAAIFVEIKNEGEDAFKPETYGNIIIIERRITELTSSIALKDHQGRKIAQRAKELDELIDHFNIDVENPCVVMSQDKSREFLHSGNDKDKFKFFFKATLLQQVSELLEGIKSHLNAANAVLAELELSIRPIIEEVRELREKVKNMEHVEEIAQEVENLKKKLAWSWVYDVGRQIEDQNVKLEKLKQRVPTCQARIDRLTNRLDELKTLLGDKKAQITSLMEKTSDVRRIKEELQSNLLLAKKERAELEAEYFRGDSLILKMRKRVRLLEQQLNDTQEQLLKDTQAEEAEVEKRVQKLQDEINLVQINVSRLLEEEKVLTERLSIAREAIKELGKEAHDNEKKCRGLYSQLQAFQQQQTNKVTAFGGHKVLSLLHAIERHQRKFKCPPIGPIGAHVSLANDDTWALAVENAIGRLNIPSHLLPLTSHSTTISVLRTENPTIWNVLVDMGSAERQVLVPNYEIGKDVAFEQRIQNMKEVYTSDGFRMFYRGSVQTTLPPNKRIRNGRLCSSIENQMHELERETEIIQDLIEKGKEKKRNADIASQEIEEEVRNVKRRRIIEERTFMSKQLTLKDMKSSRSVETIPDTTTNTVELEQEIVQLQDDIQSKGLLLEKVRLRMIKAEEKANHLKGSFESLCDSAKGEIDTMEGAERELLLVEEELNAAEAEKAHYEGVMQKKVLHDINEAEAYLNELKRNHQENVRKASIICPEDVVMALGGCSGSTPEQLSAKLNRLSQRLLQESRRYPDSIDDLRQMHDKKERKITKKQLTYAAFREKLNACEKALELRWSKFHRNANFLKRELTWKFNGHLLKKGISGKIMVDYDKKLLSVEVKMPQDAPGNNVRDTRGLSGGERSFSTLCFALALHDMTEAPFRAMDEFDVFMDAVSRKISLDALVEFAVNQGSQWIFITPHDISMVKAGDRVRKQQMPAPLS
ncbi:structural maintenance of chromosomes protein 6A-like isoform X2 [Phalaenopsis equestris]|uniref:structural maintenance of chromosomes protein 6A-like isoform X2 n=1 Tax=Phalaenopsis equestris TaxID=78828 RepID=UPI0009E5F8E4|nr:structural maintenance of chromosomes protein 6A-like isoform X2 [Phalaenopsis equestris]